MVEDFSLLQLAFLASWLVINTYSIDSTTQSLSWRSFYAYFWSKKSTYENSYYYWKITRIANSFLSSPPSASAYQPKSAYDPIKTENQRISSPQTNSNSILAICPSYSPALSFLLTMLDYFAAWTFI
jgi:hypothetical protein